MHVLSDSDWGFILGAYHYATTTEFGWVDRMIIDMLPPKRKANALLEVYEDKYVT